MKNIKGLIIASAVLVAAVGAQADVLYNIASFNNDGSSSPTDSQWIAGITTINVASGVTGTDDAGLVALQTLQLDPLSAARTSAPRFMNASAAGGTAGTVVTDAKDDKYFQFGILADAGNAIDLTSLSFQAVRATTGTSTRGYNIDVSINGGAYSLLNAENVANMRNDGLQDFDLAMSDSSITSVDFRISSTGGGVEYTNFAINGSVAAIPEPGTLGLIGAFGGGLLFIRRKFMI